MLRALYILSALLLTACATTGASGTSTADGPSRAMLGLDDEPLTAQWREWTPVATLSTPDLNGAATAFDYWQVTDEAFIEEAWAAIFGVLHEARAVAPRAMNDTFRMLMTVLEPQNPEGTAHLDATFFASQRGAQPAFEGVAWRLWRELPSGATPGVTVWLQRQPGGSDQSTAANVWLYGGFAETDSLTVTLAEDGWKLSNGLVARGMTPTEHGEPALLHDILRSTFWRPVTGPAYIETTLARREEAAQTPQQQPIALGLVLGARDIDQVFNDSVFVPRFTLFPTKQQ